MNSRLKNKDKVVLTGEYQISI